ncbi:S8 family serine peptidase [Synechococcales cyanobacterium C]|uniref:S8 family serine peptidase n=1 Tax=Petrachloros mirabilis ULC683 TaxID=2781853 RepID=A0A8K1ZWN7_9CYAN|nr:S8 family peptidase [Petrachloros mirabilis]NCJ05426.1 S8 family serine peptidase [Petrachloros mirabilis ULC683]
MQIQLQEVFTSIDPRIQLHLDRRARGLVPPATASTAEGEIAVIAKISDLASWLNRSEVFPGANLGNNPDGTYIVTARVPLNRVEILRQLPYVQSLKASQVLKPALKSTIEEVKARVDLLPPLAQGQQGKGVVVGIIDYGCDFLHQNFRHPDGSTRILALWDQTALAGPSSHLGYGRVYTQTEINAALRSVDPYTSLGHDPGRASHGTHVMDIACGNGGGSSVPGVAPQADIIFVQISASDIPWQGEDVVGSNFGGSVQLLEAIQFIFEQAGTRPCVINISLGTNGGSHDGTSLVEQGIDAVVTAQPNRAVVIAASNSYEDGIHASGKVIQGNFIDVIWQIGEFDFTHNELEVWYGKDDQLKLELIDQDDHSIGEVDLGASARILNQANELLFFVAHRQGDPNNGDHTIGIFMNTESISSSLPSQIKLRLHGVTISDGQIHAWIERDDNGQSNFAPPHDNSHTLGSISCGEHSIVVGSYDAHTTGQPLSWFSSAGPTRDGRQKPEISAPGHNVLAANSSTRVGVTRMSGTSMAAPAVTGVVALILAEARSLNQDLTVDQIRDTLTKTARANPPDMVWNDRYGMGRVDASASVQKVRDLP